MLNERSHAAGSTLEIFKKIVEVYPDDAARSEALKYSNDTFSSGSSTLRFAAASNQPEIVEFMLTFYRSDMERMTGIVNIRDTYEPALKTALGVACLHYDIAPAILDMFFKPFSADRLFNVQDVMMGMIITLSQRNWS